MSEFKVGDRVKTKASYKAFDGERPGMGIVGGVGGLLVIAGGLLIFIGTFLSARSCGVEDPESSASVIRTIFGLAVPFLVASAPFLVWSRRSVRRKREDWQRRVEFAARAWVCHRCGNVWEGPTH